MQFIVESRFAVAPTPEILALVPSETARGLELDGQGIRLQLFLAADQSRAWQIFEMDSRDEVEQVMASFPLHAYMSETITPLADLS